jgi:hypothetical protein
MYAHHELYVCMCVYTYVYAFMHVCVYGVDLYVYILLLFFVTSCRASLPWWAGRRSPNPSRPLPQCMCECVHISMGMDRRNTCIHAIHTHESTPVCAYLCIACGILHIHKYLHT